MIPKTLSATSIQTAIACPRRFHAENILKTPTPSGDAAMRGSVCHGALEDFVNKVIMDKTLPWEWEVLETFLIKSYTEIYGSSDTDTEAYADCKQMLERWFARTDIRNNKVIELENKKTFALQTSIGVIPFTYIIDRLDEVAPGVYRVVDYKSIRAYIPPEELRSKLQARVYSLAIQIEHPEAEEIWVEFDMLRHEDTISIKFTKEDNAKTWYYLKAEAERIIAQDDTDPNRIPENLNNECMYCVRKSECNTLIRHAAGGGVLAKTGEEAVRLKLEVQAQLKGLKYLEESLDALIMAEAQERDEFEWSISDGFEQIEVKLSARATTTLNTQAVSKVIGPELLERYGNLTVTSVNKLLKSGELTDEQIKEVKQYMAKGYGDPKPKVTKKTII